MSIKQKPPRRYVDIGSYHLLVPVYFILKFRVRAIHNCVRLILIQCSRFHYSCDDPNAWPIQPGALNKYWLQAKVV